MEFFSAAQARAVRPTPSMIPRCDQCKLYRSCLSPKMAVDGAGRRRVLLVSEYPGAEEDRQGRPLVGPSGQLLEKVLRELGVDMRRDCKLTNALICYDTNKKGPKTAVDDCRPHLLRTLAAYKPEVVVLLGGTAIQSLIPHLWKPDIGKTSVWVGQDIPSQRINAWVCPTYNPAALLRKEEDRVMASEFRRHLSVAFGHSGVPWPDGPPNYEASVERIMDPEVAADRLSGYRDGLLAFDFETTTLKPDGKHARIVCCSVCWEGRETIAYPWHGRAIEETKRILMDPAIGKIGSNIKFEARWVKARLGITVKGWAWDTMLAAHALDPRRGVTSIKFQAFVKLGQPDFNSHLEPYLVPVNEDAGGNAPNQIERIGTDLLLRYNGMDSLLEYRVARAQMSEVGVSF